MNEFVWKGSEIGSVIYDDTREQFEFSLALGGAELCGSIYPNGRITVFLPPDDVAGIHVCGIFVADASPEQASYVRDMLLMYGKNIPPQFHLVAAA